MKRVPQNCKDEMFESITAFFNALTELTKLGTKLVQAEAKKKERNLA
jgi:hypothetical protein